MAAIRRAYSGGRAIDASETVSTAIDVFFLHSGANILIHVNDLAFRRSRGRPDHIIFRMTARFRWSAPTPHAQRPVHEPSFRRSLLRWSPPFARPGESAPRMPTCVLALSGYAYEFNGSDPTGHHDDQRLLSGIWREVPPNGFPLATPAASRRGGSRTLHFGLFALVLWPRTVGGSARALNLKLGPSRLGRVISARAGFSARHDSAQGGVKSLHNQAAVQNLIALLLGALVLRAAFGDGGCRSHAVMRPTCRRREIMRTRTSTSRIRPPRPLDENLKRPLGLLFTGSTPKHAALATSSATRLTQDEHRIRSSDGRRG